MNVIGTRNLIFPLLLSCDYKNHQNVISICVIEKILLLLGMYVTTRCSYDCRNSSATKPEIADGMRHPCLICRNYFQIEGNSV